MSHENPKNLPPQFLPILLFKMYWTATEENKIKKTFQDERKPLILLSFSAIINIYKDSCIADHSAAHRRFRTKRLFFGRFERVQLEALNDRRWYPSFYNFINQNCKTLFNLTICESTDRKECAIKFLLERFNFGANGFKSNLQGGTFQKITFISQEDLWDLISTMSENLLQPDSSRF
jgi:hypothetical protein